MSRRSPGSQAPVRRPSQATVTNLQAFRGAKRAVYVLRGLLHDPPFVKSIQVETGEGAPFIAVDLA